MAQKPASFPLAGGGMIRSIRREEAAEAADAAILLRAEKPTGFQVFTVGADGATRAVSEKVYKTYRGAMKLRAALKEADPTGRYFTKHVVNGVIGR